MMPPHLTATGGDDPLTTNAFEVEGYTLEAAGFAVVDLDAGTPCAVTVTLEQREEIAARWREQGPPYPPGAVQIRGVAQVRFTPAIPGHTYRLTAGSDAVTRRYRGPEV